VLLPSPPEKSTIKTNKKEKKGPVALSSGIQHWSRRSTFRIILNVRDTFTLLWNKEGQTVIVIRMNNFWRGRFLEKKKVSSIIFCSREKALTSTYNIHK